MGFKILEIKLPGDFSAGELRRKIEKKLKSVDFSFTIEKQSLDARDRRNIYWLLRVAVFSPLLPGPEQQEKPGLKIPYKKRDRTVIVVGSGPAGFFCAYTLILAGFNVTLLEQGSRTAERQRSVYTFERDGTLDIRNNYAFGEGGAGTFSDGKLTSRTKSISRERDFIIRSYIKNGAPEEIAFLAFPHLGSDNLVKIVKNLGDTFRSRGGIILFDTPVTGIYLKNGHIGAVETVSGKIEADYVVFATGHSAYKTYRLLFDKGIPFRVKPFAVGCRVEHSQELINLAQWGRKALPGVKAAEYRLAWKDAGHLPVYSFCMCPGGKVVPAAPYPGLNIVNGKSDYARGGNYGNAGIVAAVDLNRLLKKETDPAQAIVWLEQLEKKFFDYSRSYAAPACTIEDFLAGTVSASLPPSSFPPGIVPGDFKHLFPAEIYVSLREGLKNFRKKLKGFEKGILLGLESKTSSPIQAVRDRECRSRAVDNLYICGEGSGWSGGIISSAADGIKAALSICRFSDI